MIRSCQVRPEAEAEEGAKGEELLAEGKAAQPASKKHTSTKKARFGRFFE